MYEYMCEYDNNQVEWMRCGIAAIDQLRAVMNDFAYNWILTYRRVLHVVLKGNLCFNSNFKLQKIKMWHIL